MQNYIASNSWAKIASEWDRDLFHPKLPVVLCERLRWIRGVVDITKNVVDIGCNKGHLFANCDRKTITSVDIDLYDLPNFVRANAQELPFDDNKFDIAVLAEVVEHCPEPIKALSEARRVAKKVVITVPWEHKWTSNLNPFSPVENIKDVEQEAKFGNPEAKEFYQDGYRHLYHETFFTPELLTEHLKKAGYKQFSMYELRYEDWVWLGVVCE